MRNWTKRILVLLLAVLFLIPECGLADGSVWECVCGTVNNSNFCGNCGKSRTAGSGKTGYVVQPGSSVNLRGYPDTSWDNVICEVPDGAVVTVYAENGNFYDLSYNGIRGYMWKTYISFTAPSHGSGGKYYLANAKLSTRTGPGTNYDGKGKTLDLLSYKGQYVKVVSAAYDSRNAIWWAQVEVTRGTKLYRLYTGVKRFDNFDVNDLRTESSLYGATLKSTYYPYYGPGKEYAQFSEPVEQGTYGTVIYVENGYAQFEFTLENGYLQRCWIPQSKLWY